MFHHLPVAPQAVDQAFILWAFGGHLAPKLKKLYNVYPEAPLVKMDASLPGPLVTASLSPRELEACSVVLEPQNLKSTLHLSLTITCNQEKQSILSSPAHFRNAMWLKWWRSWALLLVLPPSELSDGCDSWVLCKPCHLREHVLNSPNSQYYIGNSPHPKETHKSAPLNCPSFLSNPSTFYTFNKTGFLRKVQNPCGIQNVMCSLHFSFLL